MFADHGTCSRKRIIPADKVYGTCRISVFGKSYVSRNVNVCRTVVNARDLLTYAVGTEASCNVAFIIFPESFDAVEYIFSSIVADGTVCRIVYKLGSTF
jgi:hypothetical protein